MADKVGKRNESSLAGVLIMAPGLSLTFAGGKMTVMDTVLRAVRIGAFSGLAVSVYAMASGSDWLLEPVIESQTKEQSNFYMKKEYSLV